jgi:hypothetical protein
MTASLTISARSADFQRAFLAFRYFWGARDQALGEGFEHVARTPAATEVAAQLAHADRAERARALAAELARIAAALEQRSLAR